MTTKTKVSPAVDSLDKLLNRLRELRKTVSFTDLKLRRQRIELNVTTYLYTEKRLATEADATQVTIHEDLAKKIGGSKFVWGMRYRLGAFIRNNRVDMENVNPGALQRAATYALDERHLPRIVKELNSGCGHKRMDAIMADLGYGHLREVPTWRKKEVRARKKKWADWKPEMDALLNGMKLTTDQKAKLKLSLKVGNREVFSTAVINK